MRLIGISHTGEEIMKILSTRTFQLPLSEVTDLLEDHDYTKMEAIPEILTDEFELEQSDEFEAYYDPPEEDELMGEGHYSVFVVNKGCWIERSGVRFIEVSDVVIEISNFSSQDAN